MTTQNYCRNILTVICTTCLIAGCSGSGVNFKPENVGKIHIGKSTKVEIKELFGEPDPSETVVLGELTSEIEYFSYRDFGGFSDRWDLKSVSIEYIGDTVNAYMYTNSFDLYTTDFDETKIRLLYLNKTSRNEVVSLLGNRYGEISLPSNLLQKTVSESTLKTIPSTSKTVLVYTSHYLIKSGHNIQSVGKLLALSFDQNGILINKYYSENRPNH